MLRRPRLARPHAARRDDGRSLAWKGKRVPIRGGTRSIAETQRSRYQGRLVEHEGRLYVVVDEGGEHVAYRAGFHRERDPRRSGDTFAERLYETRLMREKVNTDFLPLFDHLLNLARGSHKAGYPQRAGRELAAARKLAKYGTVPNYAAQYGEDWRWHRGPALKYGRGVGMFSKRVTSTASARDRRHPRRDPPKYRDYEYVVYPSTRVEGEGIKIPHRHRRRSGAIDSWNLTDAKAAAKRLGYGAGIYSVTKGRFVGWIGPNGRFVPFR